MNFGLQFYVLKTLVEIVKCQMPRIYHWNFSVQYSKEADKLTTLVLASMINSSFHYLLLVVRRYNLTMLYLRSLATDSGARLPGLDSQL